MQLIKFYKLLRFIKMTDTIDLRFLAESQPSLCIPRVFNNINETRIRQVFDEINLGQIHHVDIIERKNEKGETVKRVYIHFNKWFWNEDAQAARRKLISGKEIKIVYDNPWFWKVSANKWTPAHPNEPEKLDEGRSSFKPHIDFDDADLRPRREPLVKQRQTETHSNSLHSLHSLIPKKIPVLIKKTLLVKEETK
jgi:hypothetical protein